MGTVELRWTALRGDSDRWWGISPAIYAYLAPRADEILYIGKADGGSSVRRRWDAADKDEFWDDLEGQRGIFERRAIASEFWLSPGARLTSQLVCDVESLLISEIKPWGNIACRGDRIRRPGLVVRCRGQAWPGRRVFRDR